MYWTYLVTMKAISSFGSYETECIENIWQNKLWSFFNHKYVCHCYKFNVRQWGIRYWEPVMGKKSMNECKFLLTCHCFRRVGRTAAARVENRRTRRTVRTWLPLHAPLPITDQKRRKPPIVMGHRSVNVPRSCSHSVSFDSVIRLRFVTDGCSYCIS